MEDTQSLKDLAEAIEKHFIDEDGEIVSDWFVGVSLQRVDPSDGEVQTAVSYATGASLTGGYGAGSLGIETLKNKIAGVQND